jgi:hypothetical protein
MTIYPRGLAFVAVALVIMLVVDWLGIDWRVGLVAISLDAILTLFPLFGRRDTARD